MIALKGGIREFSSLSRELSPTCTLKWPVRNGVQITRNTTSAHLLQRCVSRGTKGQLGYQVWQSLNLIYFSFIFIGWDH